MHENIGEIHLLAIMGVIAHLQENNIFKCAQLCDLKARARYIHQCRSGDGRLLVLVLLLPHSTADMVNIAIMERTTNKFGLNVWW